MTPKRTKKRTQRGGKAAINAHHRAIGTPDGFKLVHPQYGTGFFDALKGAFNWIKDNKVISTVASLIPHPLAQKVGGVAGQIGLGYHGQKQAIKNVLLF